MHGWLHSIYFRRKEKCNISLSNIAYSIHPSDFRIQTGYRQTSSLYQRPPNINFIEFLIEQSNRKDYLPDEYTEKTISRDWIINVCHWSFQLSTKGNTLDNVKFSSFVKGELSDRKLDIMRKKNLTINVAPKFWKIFNNLCMVSSSLNLKIISYSMKRKK